MRKTIAALAAVVLGIGVLSLGTTAATAAPKVAGEPNTGVVVTVKLADEDGNELTEQLKKDQKFLITGTWEATTPEPQTGETFVLGLPTQFLFVTGGPGIDLKGEDGEIWAHCSVSNETHMFECIFTAAVEDRTDISGTFEFEVTAGEA